MSKGKGNIQDEYLNQMRTSQALVKVLLTTGRELQGRIKAFDNFTILLLTPSTEVLLYKSAIAGLGPPGEKHGGGRP
jgi:host factor-I protein